MTAADPTPPRREPAPSLTQLVELVTDYAKQETLDPIKGAGRWIGFGLAGAATLGIGLAMVLLGVLRLLQTEWEAATSAAWSWVAYLIALVLCLVFLALTISRINTSALTKEHR
ncbi:MAG: phage holin family protein [Ilumatobacteraceae bacterium]|jgi:MFS family permease|nr:phage holin family protein [Ilumatobacteraceae bacterium]